jgi:LCP family protein required for cell wall assembly
MNKGWKLFIGISVIMLFALIGGAGYLGWSLLDANKNSVVLAGPQVEPMVFTQTLDTTPKVEVPIAKPESQISVSEEGKIYVLALGIDTRGDDLSGRTDAMMVMSIDRKHDRLDLISIPRDSYVEIAGKGKYDKINHAFAYGGVEMAQKTVEGLLGVKMDHFVVFNFSSFMSVIDTLGGVEVEVPFNFTEQDSKGRHDAIKLTKGLHTLNGEQALAYARMRHQDPTGDIGRGERQQQVVQAVVSKLASFSSISKYTDIFNAVKGSMATDVSVFDLPNLSRYVASFGTIESHPLKGADEYIDDIYYYKLNQSSLEEVRNSLK